VADPAPGQEPVALIVVVVMGLLVFVPLAIYLWVKVGFKSTLGFFTIGLRPRRHRGQRQDADPDRAGLETGRDRLLVPERAGREAGEQQ
jgi:hypothetical protein